MALITTHNFVDGDESTQIKVSAISENGKDIDYETECKSGEITMLKERYVNGKLHGLYEKFYENGQRQNLKICDGKNIIGTDIDWYPSGQIEADWNGGIRKDFYESGQIQYLREVDGEERIHNFAIEWYESGIIETKAHYLHGKKHGLYESWKINGQQSERINYFNDRLHGLYEMWYSNGQKKLQCFYKLGVEVGEYIEWYSTGIVYKHIMHNKLGKFHGFYEINYKNGKPKIRAVYANNHIVEFYEFDENSILIRATERTVFDDEEENE